MSEPVFGIDLGTTNSVIAWVSNGRAECIARDGNPIVPSVVGLDPQGRLLVGVAARNQRAAFPERTAVSIKRSMGTDARITLGGQEFAPPELSAMILKDLARRGEEATGQRVRRVVITVPAFFQDAQREATRQAGEIAGLEVVRLINEPTAAALAFEGAEKGRERTLLVYDLGGGTFDVSVVVTDGELTEVLASHGDVLLGGDDFDLLLAEHLLHGQSPRILEDPVARARLLQAAEAAKCRLTAEVSTRVREEFVRKDPPLHVDREIRRDEFEGLIQPLIERTLDSVHEALRASNRTLAQIDDILLVGGQTRTPLVGRRLQALTGKAPRRDVHPDLCVALGAAIAGARHAGVVIGPVLVDVTPYSFGPSYLGSVAGEFSEHCYHPVIERGTPLPVTRSETYFTAMDDQEGIDVRIFQGESRDARDNILIGRFFVDSLSPAPAGSPIAFRMTIGLDGILDVEVVEQITGMSKRVRIDAATARMTAAEVVAARSRAELLWAGEGDAADAAADAEPDEPWTVELRLLLGRARAVLERMAPADAEELTDLLAEAEDALARGDDGAAVDLRTEIEDLVHYAEEA